MIKNLFFAFGLLLVSVRLSAQSGWMPYASAIDSFSMVSYFSPAIDSSGYELTAVGYNAQTREHILLASAGGAAWSPVSTLGVDSSWTLTAHHTFPGGHAVLVAVDSLGIAHYFGENIASGSWDGIDSLMIAGFHATSFTAIDSITTLAAGYHESTGAPMIITSIDSGATWSPLAPSFPVAVDSALHYLTGAGAFIGLVAIDSLTLRQHVFTSIDSGFTWTAPSSTFPMSGQFIRGLAIDSLGVMYACGHDASGAAMWSSTDGGSSWLPMDLTGIDVDSALMGIIKMQDLVVTSAIDSNGNAATYYMSLTAGIRTAHPKVNAYIWPNPAQGSVHIRAEIPAATLATVEVVDMQGRILLQSETGGNDILTGYEVNTETLPSGLYIVKITAGLQSATARLSISR